MGSLFTCVLIVYVIINDITSLNFFLILFTFMNFGKTRLNVTI